MARSGASSLAWWRTISNGTITVPPVSVAVDPAVDRIGHIHAGRISSIRAAVLDAIASRASRRSTSSAARRPRPDPSESTAWSPARRRCRWSALSRSRRRWSVPPASRRPTAEIRSGCLDRRPARPPATSMTTIEGDFPVRATSPHEIEPAKATATAAPAIPERITARMSTLLPLPMASP